MGILTGRITWRRNELRILARNKLTAIEQENVRRACEYLRSLHRSREALAKALKMNYDALLKASSPRRRQTVTFAMSLAYVAGVKLEDITSGAWPPAGACPYCGHVSG